VDQLVPVQLADGLAEPGDVAGGAVDLLEQRLVGLHRARQPELFDGPLRLAALGGLQVGRRRAAVQLAATVPVRGAPPGRLVADSAATTDGARITWASCWA
jgi:hypothetical protein